MLHVLPLLSFLQSFFTFFSLVPEGKHGDEGGDSAGAGAGGGAGEGEGGGEGGEGEGGSEGGAHEHEIPLVQIVLGPGSGHW